MMWKNGITPAREIALRLVKLDAIDYRLKSVNGRVMENVRCYSIISDRSRRLRQGPFRYLLKKGYIEVGSYMPSTVKITPLGEAVRQSL